MSHHDGDGATPDRQDRRGWLRRAGDALPRASIGTVPILWNNADLPELRFGTAALTIMDELARVGFEGCQLGVGFPDGAELRDALAARGLRLAEVYAAFVSTVDGPTDGALEDALERLRLLESGDGEVLCVAFDGSADRDATAGRAIAGGAPSLTEGGWALTIDLLHDLGRATRDAGRRMAFHPHVGTYVETATEVDRLVASTDPDLVPICLDVGHYLAGGGDPVAALRALGDRVTHVHLKDVDIDVLDALRSGRVGTFSDGVRGRIFTELGSGALDLDGVLRALADRDYDGWLMVEQDSTWDPPSESAAIGRRVLASALRRIGADGSA
jgi:inosose dehydratase